MTPLDEGLNFSYEWFLSNRSKLGETIIDGAAISDPMA